MPTLQVWFCKIVLKEFILALKLVFAYFSLANKPRSYDIIIMIGLSIV